MAVSDYESWTKDDLISEIQKLNRRKKYGLVWEDNAEDVAIELQENLPVLEQIKSRLVGSEKEGFSHLLVEGDNLHALHTLNYTHANSIDLIYIDPPYNRGRDFKYNDNYVDKEDSYRHSKWLSFMSKRLTLARNILKDTGLIFISIDETEHPRLRLLCEEIFGEANLVGDLSVVNNLKGRSDQGFFATAHEFLLVCAKNRDLATLGGFPLDEDQIAEYDKTDERGNYKLVGLQKTGKSSLREDRPNLYYPIYWNEAKNSVSLKRTSKSDYEIFPIFTNGVEGNWRWSRETFEANASTEIEVKLQKRGPNVYVKMRLDGVDDSSEERTRKPKSLWLNPKYDSGSATTALRKMFGEKVFDNPKPIPFLQDILQIASDENSTILDFFAGSGSTGEAVLRMNNSDNGKRKFILVTNNEEKICEEVTYPRLSKVIKGYVDTSGEKVVGTGGTLRYFKTKLVQSKPTDANKFFITRQATGALCIKEACFNDLEENSSFAFYDSPTKMLGILFDATKMAEFKKFLRSTDKDASVYVFSLGNDDFAEEFIEFGGRVTTHPIPKALLNAYMRAQKALVRNR